MEEQREGRKDIGESRRACLDHDRFSACAPRVRGLRGPSATYVYEDLWLNRPQYASAIAQAARRAKLRVRVPALLSALVRCLTEGDVSVAEWEASVMAIRERFLPP